jgi:hypothetical protein
MVNTRSNEEWFVTRRKEHLLGVSDRVVDGRDTVKSRDDLEVWVCQPCALFAGRWENELTRNFGLGSSSGHFGFVVVV